MADAARARYDAAVAWVRGLPTDGPIKPAQATQLRFYALFTQAAKGPAARAPGASRPGMWNVVARAKYDAWAALGDLPEDEARAAYVAELLDLLDAHRDTLPADQAETDDVVELRRTLEGGAGDDDDDDDDADEDADLDDDGDGGGGGGGIGSGDVDANESDGEGESAAAGAGSASAAASAAGAAAAAASERRASGGNAAGPALVAQSLPLPRGSSAAAGAAAAAVSAATPLSASVSHSRNDALAAAVRRAEAAEAALTALTARMEVLEESNARVERSVTLRVDALQERVSRLVAMVRGHLRRSSLLGVVAGIAPLLFLFLRRRRAHRRAAGGGGRRHK